MMQKNNAIETQSQSFDNDQDMFTIKNSVNKLGDKLLNLLEITDIQRSEGQKAHRQKADQKMHRQKADQKMHRQKADQKMHRQKADQKMHRQKADQKMHRQKPD